MSLHQLRRYGAVHTLRINLLLNYNAICGYMSLKIWCTFSYFGPVGGEAEVAELSVSNRARLAIWLL